jgi:cytochrome c nitrite reductase small subunit
MKYPHLLVYLPVRKFNVCKNQPLANDTMKALDKITNLFSRRQKIFLLVVAGVICGLGGLFLYLLRAHTYIADNPSACVNCHIMTPYYATWSHSSHGRDATCNDCHVPHQNLAMKYGFKAMDGLKHVAYFVTHSERQAIMAEEMSAEVIMDNCIRCHTQLNQEFVKTGRMGYSEQMKAGGKVCWDCHRNVPHGGMNSLSSTPNAEGVTPLPPSPVPEWLQNIMNK